jgi:hypothetical protein
MGMKLYAWQPKGHGELSFFVCAEDEQAAKSAVEAEIARRKTIPFLDLGHIGEFDASGWGSDYYRLTVLEPGEAITNAND